jgi:hypothetical protein
MKYSGYMSSDALEGHFSVKSNIFSFGVLLLEILNGKKNTCFYDSDSLNLIGYVSNGSLLLFCTLTKLKSNVC